MKHNKNINKDNEKLKVLLEKWADIEHQRWSRWQEYMHSKLEVIEETKIHIGQPTIRILPEEFFDRWERQIATEYKDLSEKEKESDREQIYPYLEDVKKLLHQIQKQTKQELLDWIIKNESTVTLVEIINKLKE